MTEISEHAKIMLQETESKLLNAGFISVWQKIVERFPYDTLYSFWVNLQNGKSVLIVTHSDNHCALCRVNLYELKDVKLSELIGQSLENATADIHFSSAPSNKGTVSK